MTGTAPPVPDTSRRTAWQRWVRDPLVGQLKQGLSPDQLALTVAVGCACGLFPILGTTTLLCLGAGIWLKLNQPVLQALNQLLWPWQIASIYGCIRIGERLFGLPQASLDVRTMGVRFWHEPLGFLHDYGATAGRAMLAWALLAPFFIGAVHFSLRPVFRRLQRVRP